MSYDFLYHSKDEMSYFINGVEFNSMLEFELFSHEVLSKYLKDHGVISELVKNKAFTYEIMFIKWASGTVFEDFIEFFFNHLRGALKSHKDDLINLYIECDLKVHNALVNYQDAASIAYKASFEHKRTKVTAMFTSFGHIIESSLYPQLNLIYGILKLSKESSLYNPDNKGRDFTGGRLVQDLISSSAVVEGVLKGLLMDVPLSQWRNISNHGSYKYNKESDSIVCYYGDKNKYSITLKYDDLFVLGKSIDMIQILLKTCLELSTCDLRIDEKTNIEYENYELTVESILSQIGNVLAIFSYELVNMEKESSNWKINIKDINSLGVDRFQELGNEIAIYFLLMYKFHGISMELEVFDCNGETFQKLSLRESNEIDELLL